VKTGYEEVLPEGEYNWLLDSLRQHWMKLAVVAATLVFCVIGWQVYVYLQIAKIERSGDAYYSVQLLLEDDKVNDAKSKLTKLIEEGPVGYKILAGFRKASLTAEDLPSAGISEYRALSRTPYVKRHFLTDVARIHAGYLAIERGKMQLVTSLVGDIAVGPHPLQQSAREILLLMTVKNGDWDTGLKQANELLSSIEEQKSLASRVRRIADIAKSRVHNKVGLRMSNAKSDSHPIKTEESPK